MSVMKVGDRVKTRKGFFGTIIDLRWTASSCSGCSFISRVEILLDNGMEVIAEPEMIEAISESR